MAKKSDFRCSKCKKDIDEMWEFGYGWINPPTEGFCENCFIKAKEKTKRLYDETIKQEDQ